ncbi:MAG: minichromosome maintenance protein MCM [Candidatus Micrarchaeota archaeon]|nr:minichromosome maintenance protein MCM [Candidatus Micrarchaeota archaeon]
MASEVDIAPYVDKFEEFYSVALTAKINQLLIHYPAQKSLVVDYQELERFDSALADLLIKQPDTLMAAAEQALVASQGVSFKTAHPEPDISFEPHVRFFNLPDNGLLVQDIGSKLIREMISVKGVITKRVEMRHKVKIAVYKCQMCDSTVKVPMTRSSVTPQVCDSCKRRALKLDEDESYFVDMQWGQMQELLERLKGGAPAATITILFEDDLVNSTTPGETVEITAIMRIHPETKKGGKTDAVQVYQRYLDVVHIQKTQKEFDELDTTKEEEQEIREFSTDPHIYEKIRESVSPGIYGHDEVKEALALQLFGGTKDKHMAGGAPIRDDIHILLIGDPGAAKTRFLQSMCTIAPKAIYVSGKSVTGVGLTASAEKDELGDGGWTLKAGALVIASGGIAGVDEFDKIDDNERAAMHEVMESQTVSVAKAGIVARFKAKTGILAAANPKYSRFDETKLPGEQFNIPPTILSRFDLIFPILDVMDVVKDTKLAEYMLSTHRSAAEFGESRVKSGVTPTVSAEFLRKYVSYARRTVKPILSQAASDKIKDFYVKLREKGKADRAVPITPRQIEGLIRMSEASAKIRLSNVVEAYDAERAIRLTEYVLAQVSTDRATGKIDSDILMTGRPRTAQLDKINSVLSIVKRLQAQLGAAEIVRVIEEAAGEGIDEVTGRRIIEDLIYRSELYKVRPGFVKVVEQSG